MNSLNRIIMDELVEKNKNNEQSLHSIALALIPKNQVNYKC
jgi:hypothetical protein